jgi:SAM-dependent methyltransferase
MESKSATAAKFTDVSRGWSEREYNDPTSFMERRAALVCDWGAQLRPGDHLLELGCGDGALSCFLAGKGFIVTGIDISPGMIEEAKQRAVREGVSVRFEVADGDSFEVAEPYDGVISFMSAFFSYSEHPAEFIRRVLPFIRKKLIVDWNFRSPGTFVEAAEVLRSAGLSEVEWRPWLVPHTMVRVSRFSVRDWFENRPNLSLILLALKRWHYTVYLKGEKIDADKVRDGANGWHGNRLPGSLLQRALMKVGNVTR